MKRISILGLMFVAFSFAASTQVSAAELVYFMSETCDVCEQWDEEVGSLYEKTDEAKRMTLRPHSIHDDKPADLAFIKGVVYTPTFVMVEEGREVGRIVGYISDYFFWEQVSSLIKKADNAMKLADRACLESSSGDSSATC